MHVTDESASSISERCKTERDLLSLSLCKTDGCKYFAGFRGGQLCSNCTLGRPACDPDRLALIVEAMRKEREARQHSN